MGMETGLMRKRIARLLAVALLLGALTGCGAKNAPDASAAVPEEPETDAYSVNGSVIFEKDGVTVTTAGLDVDPSMEGEQPIIWADVVNSGDQDVYLGVAAGSVNGFMTEVVLASFREDGADYEFDITVPANSSERYALGYYTQSIPGVKLLPLAELEFCFTTAEDEYSWRNYISDPVRIVTGENVDTADISEFGTVVLDDDQMTLVIGEQDYDSFFGPEFYVYVENKTEQYLGIAANSATADGIDSDDVRYSTAVAPGKRSCGFMSFGGEIGELRGVESLTLNLMRYAASSPDELSGSDAESLAPVSVQYPPQEWGEYKNGGVSMELQPKYNKLVTVETPKDDPDGILFTVSETASMEADGFDGSGWLFSIGTLSEAGLHELLCDDMSGVEVFARDGGGGYYVWYRPTDVRYARATAEEMARDADQWTMLCEWAGTMQDVFREENELEYVSFGNSIIDMYLARAAYRDGEKYTLSTTEYGPVEAYGVVAVPFAEFVMQGFFGEVDDEAPDGEYVVLTFPDEDVRIDFFFAPGAYARVISDGRETIYQAAWQDDDVSCAEAMRGWYYAAAESAGVREHDDGLTPWYGVWTEKIAGRGQIESAWCIAPDKVQISVRWPESAGVLDSWEIIATLEEDRLVYENGHKTVEEFDSSGAGEVVDESYGESGYFYLDGEDTLCWHDDQADGGDSAFRRVDLW